MGNVVTARDDLAEVLAPHAIGDPFILVDALRDHAGLVVAVLQLGPIELEELLENAEHAANVEYAKNEPEPTTLPVEDCCPHCGGEPPEMDDHREDCPTLGTCAQCRPETPRPWHPESEWWPDGAIRYGDALDAHMREAHKS